VTFSEINFMSHTQEIYFEASEYDALAATKLKPADMKIEAELYTKKWFEYRVLHPVQATYLFADAYIKAARNLYRKTKDNEAGRYIKPFAGKDLFVDQPVTGKRNPNVKPAVFKAIWRARQQADSMGIPYDFYCEAVMRFALQQGWHRIPLAQQLYSTKAETTERQAEFGYEAISVVDFVALSWVEFKKTRIVHAEGLHFKSEKNRNLPEQKHHRANVMGQIKTRSDPALSLAYALEQDVVIERECIAYFGEATVIRAKRFASY